MPGPKNSEHVPKMWKIGYTLLLLGRVVIAPLLPGYVHPDEFFQGGQELWFGCPPATPWEFEPRHAIRSIVPPTLMTWIPLRLYCWMTCLPLENLSGREILIVPRVFCTILSVVFVDWSVWILLSASSKSKVSAWKGMLILATAWPTWVFLGRPFSNSLETCLLAFFIRLVFLSKKLRRLTVRLPALGTNIMTCFLLAILCIGILLLSGMLVTIFRTWPVAAIRSVLLLCLVLFLSASFLLLVSFLRCTDGNAVRSLKMVAFGHFSIQLLLGAVCAIGIFTRFTFICFAVPVGLYHVWDVVARSSVLGTIGILSSTAVAFMLTAWSLVCADRHFYSSKPSTNGLTTLDLNDELPLTPWNAFRYNASASNLQAHGLHPRWTHVAVNMVLLFGPLTILTYLRFGQASVCFLRNPYPFLSAMKRCSKNECYINSCQISCAMTVVVGLGLLSLAPHQEPRFLLPLIVPLVVLASDRVLRGKGSSLAWLILNIVLLIVYGILHQGGVIPSLLHLGQINQRVVGKTIFFHTYMPPTFLLRAIQVDAYDNEGSFARGELCPSRAVCPDTHVIDLGGGGVSTLASYLRDSLACFDQNGSGTTQEKHDHLIQLVAPPVSTLVMPTSNPGSEQETVSLFSNCSEFLGLVGITFTKSRSLRPHLTTEDLPFADSVAQFLRKLELGIYDLNCAARF